MSAFLLLTVLLASAPAAPNSEQCDAKPFTLNKPAHSQPAAKQKAEPGPKASAITSKTEAVNTRPKSKPLAACDRAKKKG